MQAATAADGQGQALLAGVGWKTTLENTTVNVRPEITFMCLCVCVCVCVCVSSSSSYLCDIVMTVRSKQIQAACAIQQAALVGAPGAECVKDLPKQIHLLRVTQQ